MPTVNVNIQPAIINWALSQTDEEKIGKQLMSNIRQWLDGTKIPTFNQIEMLSKKTRIPLGYFFLKTPPVEDISLLEYRTVNSVELANPSRDLIDTIHEMEDVQEWMATYRKEQDYDKVEVVNCIKGNNDIDDIAVKIRKDLEITLEWYNECADSSEAFKKIRTCLEKCGIIVMMNGVVAKDTHRALDIEEFRAFAIVNDWAPLIFINGADSANGRLFSLFHEMVHIWLGENSLYNDNRYIYNNVKPIEELCNAVAAELMVPEQIFSEKWKNNTEKNPYMKIKKLSAYFRCSENVIARKALKQKKIKESIYNQVIENTKEAYIQSRQKKNSGGDYYKVACSRLDRVFVCALCENVNSGRTSYTEAYRLTNTTSKTFPKVVSGLGGILWQ